MGLAAQQGLVLERRVVAQRGGDAGLEAAGPVGRQVVEEFAHEGALQDVAVEIALQKVGLGGEGRRDAKAPGMGEGRGLVLHADGRVDRAHGVGAESREFDQPLLAFAGEADPARVEPVDDRGQLAADLFHEAPAAMGTIAKARPEGHVEANAVQRIAGGQFRGQRRGVIAVGRIGAADAVTARVAVALVIGVRDAPVGAGAPGEGVVDQAHVADDGDVVGVAQFHRLAEDVAALRAGVHRRDERGIETVADVRMGVEHDGLQTRFQHQIHEALRIELRHETRIVFGDVHVEHAAAPGLFVPGHTGTSCARM